MSFVVFCASLRGFVRPFVFFCASLRVILRVSSWVCCSNLCVFLLKPSCFFAQTFVAFCSNLRVFLLKPSCFFCSNLRVFFLIPSWSSLDGQNVVKGRDMVRGWGGDHTDDTCCFGSMAGVARRDV